VAERLTEEVMLRLRLVEGLPLAALPVAAVEDALRAGYLSAADHAKGRAVLTLQGRLLADAVTLSLLP
jgi:oxygen-independent coproporphyrinogen-3 oxidase